MSDRGVLRFIPSRVDGILRRHRGCDLYRTIENIFIRSVHNIPICGYRHMASPRCSGGRSPALGGGRAGYQLPIVIGSILPPSGSSASTLDPRSSSIWLMSRPERGPRIHCFDKSKTSSRRAASPPLTWDSLSNSVGLNRREKPQARRSVKAWHRGCDLEETSPTRDPAERLLHENHDHHVSGKRRCQGVRRRRRPGGEGPQGAQAHALGPGRPWRRPQADLGPGPAQAATSSST